MIYHVHVWMVKLKHYSKIILFLFKKTKFKFWRNFIQINHLFVVAKKDFVPGESINQGFIYANYGRINILNITIIRVSRNVAIQIFGHFSFEM